MPFIIMKTFGTALNNAQLTSGMHDTKHPCVPKVDILNTCGKVICLHKEIASLMNIYCN